MLLIATQNGFESYMEPVSRLRLILGWTLETLLLILQLIFLLLPFPLPAFKRGRRGTIIIVTDLLTSPLFYFLLMQRLKKNGYSVYIHSGFNPLKGFRVHARTLSSNLEKWNVHQATLLCHGSGGLASLGLPDPGRQRIKYLVTMGAPFHGTTLLNWLPFIPAFHDMTPGSEYLLINRMNALLFPSFSPFVPWKDEWIVPGNLARFGQGRDLILDWPGRMNLLFSRDVGETIIEHMNREHPFPVTATHMAAQGPEPEGAVARPQVQARPSSTKKAVRKNAPRTAKKKAKKSRK
ncbi:MAG: hypothetical protein KDK23_00120 [Leptospiraceae bacterium]|nr:hypothetical protein [Leptospiraceae bacterium]